MAKYVDASITDVDGDFLVDDATVSVIDASEFEAPGTVKVWDRADPTTLKAVIYFTGITGDDLTGCVWNNFHADVDIADGDRVAQTETHYNYQVPTSILSLGGRVPGETPHVADDFFESYSGYTEHEPSGTAVWSATRGGLACKFNDVAASNLAVAVKAIPVAGVPITIETSVQVLALEADNPLAGLIFTNGVVDGSSFAAAAFIHYNTGQLVMMEGTLAAATSNVDGIGNFSLLSRGFDGFRLLRLTWSAANTFTFSVSLDGDVWTDFGNGTFSRTFTPTHMGFCGSNWGTGPEMIALFRPLRVYEANLSV